MATFTNRANLSFNGGSVDSNTVTGEILEVLAGEKTAVVDTYAAGDSITYLLTLRNTGPAALTGLTITDDLGAYTVGAGTVYPLAYVPGTVLYYVNGTLQPAPAVTAGPPLSITGISIPAGGNVLIVYEAQTTDAAPPQQGGSIVNTAQVTGGGLSAPVVLTETVTTLQQPDLSISKALCPTTVTENGTLSYTFVIENAGNSPAAATDNLSVTDTFNPILTGLTVTLDGAVLTPGTDYTYDETTGAFATVPGVITVPAATFTQNPDGTFNTTPGTSSLVVTGTV